MLTFVLYECIITITNNNQQNEPTKQNLSYKGGINYLIELIELNKVYKMDNLELLNQLPNNYIDLIYSDILFNTGKKFKDYNDNLGTPQQAIEWYRPRIEEMYRVLKDTGSIYLHMDYRLVHYIKVLMDEIFGFDNFRNEIYWRKRNGNLKAPSNKLNIFTDNILHYTKSNKYTYNIQYKSYPNEYLKRFKYDDNDGNGKYRWSPLACYSDEKIKELESQNRLRRGKNAKQPEFKYYLKDLKGIPLDNIWDDINMINAQSNERINYDTQKPKELIHRIINISSNKDDIVLDLFCGSGTSMVVAKELGRKYIGCDISERAIEISEKRLNEVDGNGKLDVS